MTVKDEGAYNFNGTPLPGLSKLVEECGELQHELGSLQKILGKLIATNGTGVHWDGELFTRLETEMADVYAALDFVAKHWPQLRAKVIEGRRGRKLRTFEGWHRTNAH